MKTTRNSMLVVAFVVTLGLLFSGTAFGVNDIMMLGDYVWVDSNEDGIQDPGEPGVEGVTVTLYKYAKRYDDGFYYIPEQVGSYTTTDEDGWYEFSGLGWGMYYLVFELPSGYSWTKQDATGDDTDSDVDANGKTDDFPMGGVLAGYDEEGKMIFSKDDPAVDDLTRDAGLVSGFSSCDMSLGDYVWVDTDRDGTQNETGTGVAGIQVDLYEHQSDSSGVHVGTQTTDGDGHYLFTYLQEGEYYLVFSQNVDHDWTAKDSGADDLDSDVDASGKTDPFFLDADSCEDDLTRDAGLVRTTFTNPGCGTPGYWKNHPNAWPVEEIMIGGILYSKADAINRMKKIDKRDMRYLMFMHLVSAKLNVLIGNSDAVIAPYIAAGDAWMALHAPIGLPDKDTKVTADSDAWQVDGEDIKDWLDAYNNGLLDAPARD